MTDDAQRAAAYRDLFGGAHEHPSDCALCPICATIGILRARPEVLDHLAGAAREMISAFSILLEEAEGIIGTIDGARKTRTEETPGPSKVRRIDVG